MYLWFGKESINMKKILFSAVSLDVGGIETALVTLLNHLANEKENEEIKFRKKARHFLIRNREAFYKIEENLQYYEDIFYLMYMLLKKDCYLKRTDLEREYEKHGYEKKFENYFISQKILNSLRDTFYDKLAVDKTGKVEVKRNDDEIPIKDNEKFKKFQSKYWVKSGVIGFTAIKIIWAVEQEEL